MRVLIWLLILTVIVGRIQAKSFPKIIWVYWEGGKERMRTFTKLCLSNMDKYKHDWELRFISDQDEHKWLGNYQQFIHVLDNNNLDKKNGKLRPDLLRLYLLRQYGGVWLDANIIMTENLEWVQKINTNPDVVNKYGSEPQVLLFYYQTFGSRKTGQYRTAEGSNQSILISPGFETWFIAAMPNALLIDEWIALFEKFIQQGRSYIQQTVRKNSVQLGNLGLNIYMATSIALQTVIQKRQTYLDYNEQQRKFAVHHYSLWTINSEVGPLLTQKGFLGYNLHGVYLRRLITWSFQEYEQRMGKLKYFVKLTSRYYRKFDGLFLKSASMEFSDYMCPWDPFYSVDSGIFVKNFKVRTNSVIDKYLLSQQPELVLFPRTATEPEGYCQEYQHLFMSQLVILLVFTVAFILIKLQSAKQGPQFSI